MRALRMLSPFGAGILNIVVPVKSLEDDVSCFVKDCWYMPRLFG